MDTQTSTEQMKKPERRENMLINIGFNVVLPTIILMKFSGEKYLGPDFGLIVALCFPIFYGLHDYLTYKKINGFSILGLVSVLLTGGIGLLKLDPEYIAFKEASIPALVGIAVLVSMKTKYPLVKVLLYNDKVLNITKVTSRLEQHGNSQRFESALNRASYLLALSFFVSSTLNYLLARWVVTADAGTELFNQQLGKMAALSFPVIAVPAMIISVIAIVYLFRSIKQLTELSWEQIVHHPQN